MKVFSGGDLSKVYTRNEIQDMLYDAFGIPKSRVAPSSRDKMVISFSLQKVNDMDEDEFNWYFTLDPVLIDEDGPKSNFKEASKRMKNIEDNVDTSKSKSAFVLKDLTFEDYMKKTTPKSSFREANKRMKQIEDENNR